MGGVGNGMARWLDVNGRENFALNLLAKGFARNEKGEPTFKGWALREAQAMLVDDVEVSESIPAEMRFELVQTAIWDAARHGKLDNGTFLEQLTNRESEYLRRPLSSCARPKVMPFHCGTTPGTDVGVPTCPVKCNEPPLRTHAVG